MNILYVSLVSSPAVLDKARAINPSYGNHAVHKFNRLVIEGLLNNEAKVTVLSTFYISNRRFWHHKRESVNGVAYRYIPSLNIGPIRFIGLFFYCFFYVFSWGVVKTKNKAVVCDALNASACAGSVLASRLIGLKCAGIMTDMPGLIVSRSNKAYTTFRDQLFAKFCLSYLKSFTHLVFLTEQMNSAVNHKHRPYIVMEGLVDIKESTSESIPHRDEGKRIILYAGGLHERYGSKMLVEAFMKLAFTDVELWLYGNGPFAQLLPEYKNKDPRIHYFGMQANSTIVEAEKKATLLVNPRPTHEEFTQYSFPSKNMEYMASGTPLLTTKLPGMPKEYYEYVFLFDEESEQGYYDKLNNLLSLPPEQLKDKGLAGRKFVLNNKNNVKQCRRILDLIRS